MFNRGKVRDLAKQAAGYQADLEKAQRVAAEKILALEAEIEECKRSAETLAGALSSLFQVLPEAETRAREIVAAALPNKISTDQLPQAFVGITVVDNENRELSKEVGELCQSFSFALVEFLRSPSVEKISRGSEAYRVCNMTFTRGTHEISIAAPYHAELEVVTSAIYQLLENVFSKRSAKITLLSMDKAAAPKITFMVRTSV